jgi:predicted PurR-regulated permease PerM
MTKRTTSLVVLAVAVAALLLFAPDVLLIVFAGIPLAMLLQGGGHWIARKLGIADGRGIGLLLTGVLATLVAFGIAVAPSIADQVDELTRRLPEAFETFRERIDEYSWG